MAKLASLLPLLSAIFIIFMVQLLPFHIILVAGDCGASGKLTCHGVDYPTYDCSPSIITGAATPAKLTVNNFSNGGDGRGPAECDNAYHDDTERIVALSTRWYNGGSNCFQLIWITASNGQSVQAKVIDECDSLHGCDVEHAYQPPCGPNIVDASQAVWDALGLDSGLGEVDVTCILHKKNLNDLRTCKMSFS